MPLDLAAPNVVVTNLSAEAAAFVSNEAHQVILGTLIVPADVRSLFEFLGEAAKKASPEAYLVCKITTNPPPDGP
jgi:hypothetical protein